MILMPIDAPGVNILRHLPVFGYDDAPHGHMEVELKDVRVPADNMLLGEGRGFEIAQGRLGPGRIHHCMRTIGVAEEALEKMCKRLQTRSFRQADLQASVWEERVARARIDIDMTRLLCLKAADMMDKVGNKAAKQEIAMIKVQAPNMALDHRRCHSGAWRRRRVERLTVLPMPMPISGRCGLPMVRTKCTHARSRGWNLASISRKPMAASCKVDCPVRQIWHAAQVGDADGKGSNTEKPGKGSSSGGRTRRSRTA